MSRCPSLVVLGIGNLLLGDDAAGVHIVQALSAAPDGLPEGTTIVDGGTGGLSLLPVIAEADELVLVDAVDLAAQPGHVEVLTGAALRADAPRLSVHEAGVSDLVAAARLTGVLPERTVLIGVQPGRIAPGLELSPPVTAALPLALGLVRQWCNTLLGFAPA